MSQTLEKAVHEAEEFRAGFVRMHFRSAEDAMALAVAMMQQAEMIFVSLGGKDHAAAQFYAKADALAAPVADLRRRDG